MPKADLVLEGGGIKGIGLVGAVLKLIERKYEFQRVAGTSAGSIVAALLAAGASRDQRFEAMSRLDYPKVPDREWPCIPVVSEGAALLRTGGAYRGAYIHDFIEGELGTLGVQTFGDLVATDPRLDPNLHESRRYKLMVTATDVTNGRLLRLPWDYPKLGLPPDTQSVATAVRASISIPLYFEPVTLTCGDGKKITLVDGGVLSNFPIAAFDRTVGKPRWPTFGVKIIPDLPTDIERLFPGIPGLPSALPPIDMIERVAATAIVGHDQTYLERPCVRRRTITVDTSEIGIVEFDAPPETREAVQANGEAAAAAFLKDWNWDEYRRDCRPAARARRPRASRR
jgi:NTE family protein